jgi:hypothetical protein
MDLIETQDTHSDASLPQKLAFEALNRWFANRGFYWHSVNVLELIG